MANEWNVAYPIDSTKIGDVPGEDRKITTKVKTVLEKEHADLGDGNSGAQHRTGSAVANEGTTTPTKTVDITSGDDALANTAIDRGRLWLDDNFDPPVLKRWTGTAWEVVGTIAAGASPNLAKLISTTAEDGDGGRESQLVFKGTQSGDEETTLGAIEFSHEGASDDQKGQMRVLVNDGNDDDTPSKVALVVKSTGKIDASESLSVLDEDDMTSDDADCLATQQSIKAHVAASVAFGAWSTVDSLSNPLAINEIYKAGSDGFVIAIDNDSDNTLTLFVETGDATPDVIRSVIALQGSGLSCSVMSPVRKDDYWAVECASAILAIYWMSVGSGTCVKQ